jgi:uncharacterized membrane protein (DUF2068 family)
VAKGGDSPRSRRLLKLIAAERIVRSLLLAAAGVYLLTHLDKDFGNLAAKVLKAVELDPRRPFFHRIVVYLHDLHASEIKIAALLAIGYGILERVEGIGLWMDQLWAEYLTVIATSLLLPYEIYELIHRPTIWKVGGIAINIVIVIYLARLLRHRVKREHAKKLAAARE